MKEVANKTTTELAAYEGNWGAGENIDARDVKLSKIWIMQGSSKAVKRKTKQLGQLVDSVSLETLGDEKEPCSLIVFYRTKVFEVTKEVPGERQEAFVKYVEVNAENRLTPFEPGDGNRWRTCHQFYCLVVGKDGKVKDLPSIISMRKTGIDVAKDLITLFGVWAKNGKSSASKIIELRTLSVDDVEDPYHTFCFTEGRETTVEEKKLAYDWYLSISQSKEKYEIDTSEFSSEAAKPSYQAKSDDDGFSFMS